MILFDTYEDLNEDDGIEIFDVPDEETDSETSDSKEANGDRATRRAPAADGNACRGQISIFDVFAGICLYTRNRTLCGVRFSV